MLGMNLTFKAAGNALLLFWVTGSIIYTVIISVAYIYRAGGIEHIHSHNLSRLHLPGRWDRTGRVCCQV
jgi:hypothetical protein